MKKIILLSTIVFFLLIAPIQAPLTSVTKGNFKVEWTPIREGIEHYCYEINIQNLDTKTQDFNLSALFSNTSFEINEIKNVELSEWKALDTEFPIYNTKIVYYTYPILGGKDGKEILKDYPSNCWNDTKNITHYPCNETYQSGLETKKLCQWELDDKKKEVKKLEEVVKNYDVKTLPETKSKEIKDDFGTIETKDGTKKFKLCFDVPVNWDSEGLVGITDEATSNFYHPWWNSSWGKCKNITITGATATLTNFPAFINLSYDSDMQADWDDIRFVNTSCGNSGSELDYEFVENDSNAGEFWVRIPSLPAVGRTISVYYNNSGVGSGENPTGVWDSNYGGVWHLPDNSTTTILGSTSNANHGTKLGANEPIEATGKIYHAQDFDGSNDEINVGNNSNLSSAQELTIEAWIKLDALNTGYGTILAKAVGIDPQREYFFQTNNAKLEFWYSLDGGEALYITSAGDLTTDWTYVTCVYDINNVTKQYINGTQDATTGSVAQINTNIFQAQIGTWGNSKEEFQGLIDEVRFSKVNRSADWINMSYQIVDNQDTYVVEGSEETAPVADTNPNTTLNLPADNYINDTDEWDYINFTVNATDDYNLINCSLWHNATGTWHKNATNSITGTANQTSFALNLTNVSFIWNAYCCDNASQCNWSVSNRTIYLNWTDPDIPKFSNFVSYPINGSYYSYGTDYQFNATVISTNGSVEIEFNNTHYTATNITANGYNASIGDLSAETYMYYWLGYGNGSWNQYNFSAQLHYTVLKANPNGTLNNDTILTRTYDGVSTTINYTETQNGDGDVTYVIFKDNVSVGTSDSEACVGVYYYHLNTTGGYNYSSNASMDSLILNITQATPSINLTLNSSQSNITINQYDIIDLNCSTITGDSSANLVLIRNGTIINNATSPIGNSTNFTSAILENITCIYENTQNYSRSYQTWWVNVLSDTEYPQFSNSQEYPIDPATYVYGQDYLFNITITSTNGTAGCEFNGTNYTADNTSSLFNITVTDLAVNNYSYYWWAFGNGTSNLFNNSVTYYYNVTKANPDANLTNDTILAKTYDGVLTNISYTESNNGDGDLTYVIYKNGASVGASDSEAGVGTYIYVLNTTGGENYTSNASIDTFTLNITQATSSCSLTFDQVSPITYGTQLNATCSCTNPESSATLYRNGTDVTATENNALITLGVANWSYVCNTSNTQNYTSASNSTYFVVNNASGNISLLLNGVSNNLTVTYPQQTNITASTLYGSIEIYKNGTNITSENVLNITRAVGYYNITAFSSGDANHSGTNMTYWLNVSIGTGQVYTYLNNSRANITIYQGSSIWLNATLNTGDTGNLYLYNNGTLINNDTSPLSNLTTFSTIGLFNISGYYLGSTNYTSDWETWWVNLIADYPIFSNYNVNVSRIGNGSYARFNLTISNTNGISYANGTVNNTMVAFLNTSGTHWYYDFLCNSSGNITWNNISANDTYNNWNYSALSRSFYCDADFPIFSGQAVNNTSINQNDYFCVNITITDASGYGLDTVYAEINNTLTLINYSMSNTTSVCGGGGNTFEASIQATNSGIYNYSKVWANDTANNINVTDFADISINVTYVAPAVVIAPEVIGITKRPPVEYNLSIEVPEWIIKGENLSVNISIINLTKIRRFTNINMIYDIVDENGLLLYRDENVLVIQRGTNYSIDFDLLNISRGKYSFIARGEYELKNMEAEEDFTMFSNVVEMFVNLYYDITIGIVSIVAIIITIVLYLRHYSVKEERKEQKDKIETLSQKIRKLEGKLSTIFKRKKINTFNDTKKSKGGQRNNG